jgi:RND superfamily putative drug exporter
MSSLARFVTRHKVIVIVAWIVAAGIMGGLGAGLADKTTDDFASFLPKGAESAEVQTLLRDRFPGGETGAGLVVYRREGGLTAADRAKIAQDAERIDKAIPVVAPTAVPFAAGAPQALVSPERDAAYAVVTIPSDFKNTPDWGKETRDIVGSDRAGDGLDVYVTGDLGFFADFEEVFADVDALLLLATVLLVLLLLGAIYRAPVIAFIPILVVGFAYTVATGFIFLYAESGASVNSNGTSILIVLMFGVGTDYCLLLVSRYREELRRIEDKNEAMQVALRRSGPALVASGCTVIAAMLVLLLAEAGSTNALGPVSAIGVACALLAGLTLLPALLSLVGRRGFWPRASSVAYDPAHAHEVRAGVWRRVGDRVLKRPALALFGTLAMFVVFGLGLLAYQEDYSIGGAFKTEVESITGFEVLGETFPPGALAPTAVVVRSASGGPADDRAVQEARSRLEGLEGVAAVGDRVQRSKDGRLARFDVTFADDPYSEGALARVDTMRDRLDDLGPDAEALVGAGSAVQSDFNQAAERDLRVIVPIALLVIAIILGILLQAVVAPIVLIATVMASFFGTLGLSIFFFLEVLGDRGVDASLPTFAFIFLVALGIDYTIFLMSRVREEARVHGTREGTLRALAATGPVITSAGIILAGTFAVLMTLPVTFAFNIGLHGRRGHPARHVRRPHGDGPGGRRAARRPCVVAVDREGRRACAARVHRPGDARRCDAGARAVVAHGARTSGCAPGGSCRSGGKECRTVWAPSDAARPRSGRPPPAPRSSGRSLRVRSATGGGVRAPLGPLRAGR